MNEFDFLFDTDGLTPLSKLPSTQDIQLDDFFWQTRKPANNDAAKKAFSASLAEGMLGDFPNDVMLGLNPTEQTEVQKCVSILAGSPEPTAQQAINAQLESSGIFGKRVQSLMNKTAYSLPEAMKKMVDNFREFFSLEEQQLLTKQIAALDLAAFFQMFDRNVLERG